MAGFPKGDLGGMTNSYASNFVYVHLMRNFSLEETQLAKKAYEKVLNSFTPIRFWAGTKIE